MKGGIINEESKVEKGLGSTRTTQSFLCRLWEVWQLFDIQNDFQTKEKKDKNPI